MITNPINKGTGAAISSPLAAEPAEFFDGAMPQHPSTRVPFGWMWCSTMIAIVVAVRAWVLFSTPAVPGINGAYYLVQVRSLLEHGHLALPDLPLTFALQALLTIILKAVGGLDADAATLLAVKLCDSILPALAAIPVYALLLRFRPAAYGEAAAWAGVAVLAAPIVGAIGDFQKNAVALLWFAGLLASLAAFLDQRSRLHAVSALVFLALGVLTHIGVFAVMLLFTGLVLAVELARRRVVVWRQVLAWGLLSFAVCTIAGLTVAAWFDPHRISRLLSATLHPLAFVQSGPSMGGIAPPPCLPPGGGPPGAMHGPPMALHLLPSLLCCGTAVVVMALVFLRRAHSPLPW